MNIRGSSSNVLLSSNMPRGHMIHHGPGHVHSDSWTMTRHHSQPATAGAIYLLLMRQPEDLCLIHPGWQGAIAGPGLLGCLKQMKELKRAQCLEGPVCFRAGGGGRHAALHQSD